MKKIIVFASVVAFANIMSASALMQSETISSTAQDRGNIVSRLESMLALLNKTQVAQERRLLAIKNQENYLENFDKFPEVARMERLHMLEKQLKLSDRAVATYAREDVVRERIEKVRDALGKNKKLLTDAVEESKKNIAQYSARLSDLKNKNLEESQKGTMNKNIEKGSTKRLIDKFENWGRTQK